MPERRRAVQLTRAVLVASALVPCCAAADGLSAYIEPDYNHTVSRSTDQSGKATSTTTDEFDQHYRLMLDRSLLPYMRVDAIGSFDRLYSWTDNDGVSSRADEWRAGGAARLLFGPPVIGGQLGYERHDDDTGSSTSVGRVHNIREVYSAYGRWRPADWPSVDLRLSRSDAHDSSRLVTDSTVNDVQLITLYNAFQQLKLSYFLAYTVNEDHISTTTSSAISNLFRTAYGDVFNHGRTSVTATYQLSERSTQTSTQAGPGGTVASPQIPIAGLSAVETFPIVSETVTLAQNPALVDGDLTASAGVNLGFSVSLGGDTNARDLGVLFASPNTPVNTLYVWVDRQLPAQISGAFTWAAYRSEDNVTWTRINLAAPVVFSAFQNRFEITIQQTQARYLKVVTRPLGATVTADKRFSDIFVTELQTFLVVPAQSVTGTVSSLGQTMTAALRHQLLDVPALAFDTSAFLTRQGGASNYAIQEGLAADHRLSPILALAARVGRQDQGTQSPGVSTHTGAFQYSAQAIATPLPSQIDTLTYSGQYQQSAQGSGASNSVSLVNRTQIYRGVDAFASASYQYNLLVSGARARGPALSASLSVVPNPVFSCSAAYFMSRIEQTGGGVPSQLSDSERFDVSASLTPFPALYLNASVSRIVKGVRPTTLATLGGSFSPFPDGNVLLRASYTESFDTSLQEKSSVGNVGVRWNVGHGSYLDVGEALLDSSAVTGSSNIRAFQATFVLQI
jgi:hypothetical protein